MANTLKPKRSSTAAKVPTTTDLASGELGVNMADRKIYINNGTSVVQVGAGLLSALGDVDTTGLATGNTISWNGTKFVASAAGSGTVSSVALSLPAIFTVSGSPVTTAGTLSATLASQTANTVWAAPNGSAGSPTFRALVAADIPALTLDNLPTAWVKKAADCATTAALTLNSAQTTIDGISITSTTRVLVKDQATSSQNGIYTNVNTTTWVRAVDADTAGEIAGATVSVDAGTVNFGTIWTTTFRPTDTLGTTAMAWYKVIDTSSANSTAATIAMNGTQAAGTSLLYARADHVHPTDTSRAAVGQTFFLGTTSIAINRASASIALTGITSIDGSAATLTTGRTIGMTGDVTWTSASFNGSANVTGTATLANSGVTAGTYTKVTVDAKGRVTVGESLATADLPTTLQTNSYAPGLTGSTSNAVAAAGTTQGTATALTSDVNIVTSSTAGTALGVVMMGATSGKYAVVVNRSANAINLYPASGHAFDGLAVNTPISIPVNGFIEMFGSSTTQWHTTYQAIVQGSFVIGAVPTASALATARAIAISGDATGSANFDGTAGISIATTLANSGVTAGTYTKVTVDAKGRVTSGASLASADLPTYTGTLTSSQVTTALGFTPYNSTNPNGYTSNTGTVTSIVAGTGLSGGTITTSGTIALANTTVTAGTYTNATITVDAQGRITSASSGSGGGVTSFNTRTGAITLTSSDVTTALGFTPYDSTNPSGYITSSALSSYLPLTGGTLTGNLTISTVAPLIVFAETDQTLPAGRRRLVLDGNLFTLRRNTAAAGNFSTETNDFTVDASSNFSASGNVTAYSDERLKTNWRDLPADLVDRLAGVKHGIYDRRDLDGLTQVGVSAQSLQAVLAQAVMTNDNGLLSVNYGSAALVSAVALAQRVIQLEARIAELELKAA